MQGYLHCAGSLKPIRPEGFGTAPSRPKVNWHFKFFYRRLRPVGDPDTRCGSGYLRAPSKLFGSPRQTRKMNSRVSAKCGCTAMAPKSTAKLPGPEPPN